MLGQRRQKQKLSGSIHSIEKIKIDPIVIVSFALLMVICMYPALSLAATIEDQLDRTNTLVTGKGKTIGVSVAAIFGTVVAMFKGNPKLAGMIVGIGVFMALFLEWIGGGMKLIA